MLMGYAPHGAPYILNSTTINMNMTFTLTPTQRLTWFLNVQNKQIILIHSKKGYGVRTIARGSR